MADAEVRSGLSAGPISADHLIAALGARSDGAVVAFEGRVRSSNAGRTVRRLHYEAYDAMAREVLDEIGAEARERFEIGEIVVHHRLGSLEVGEVSLAIVACAPHRGAAFDAVRFAIEQIKHRVPIWKREEYADGSSTWLDGEVPPGHDHPSRPGVGEVG